MDGQRTSAGLIRPPRLRPGDRVAAVSLSWGGPGTFPERYRVGVRQLRDELGLEVVEMPSTCASAEMLDADPSLRLADLHAALADPSISGIISTIGGDDSIRWLPDLDLDLVAANPKVFVGYSDTTIAHMAFRAAGVVSFYGPSVMAGFGEAGGMHRYLVDGVRQAMFDPVDPNAVWTPNDEGWTTEHVDWSLTELLETPRDLHPTSGWRWHGGTPATGPTVAGCMEALDWLRGSRFDPDLDGVVLLLETSEEAPPPEMVTRYLRTLALTGSLDRLAGLVLGRPGGADLTDEERLAYDAAVLRVVRTERHLDIPVVTNVDFGHTDPMWTIPEGVALRVDPVAESLTFVEPGVS